MTQTVNQINGKIKRCETNISSLQKTIARWQRAIDNPQEWVTESNIKQYKNIIRDSQKKLNKEEAKLAELKGMLVGNTKEYPEVRQFVETWKKTCIESITNPQTIENCITAYNEMKQEQKKIEDGCKAAGKPTYTSYREREQLSKSFLREWGYVFNYIKLSDKTIKTEELERDYKYEAERKYNKFIEDAEFYVGEITDTSNLSIGMKGDLNGFVVGKKGKAEVETISACGPVQRFHYRTLFKMAK